MTLATIWRDYCDEWVIPHEQELRRVMYTWKKLKKFFGADFKVKRMKVEDSREYRKHRLAQGVCDSTIRRELTLLAAAIGHAFKEGRIKVRPRIDLPPQGKPRERYLSIEEVRRLWPLVEKADPRTRLCMWILLYAWVRAGAAEDLEVGRVDLFKTRTIDFRNPAKRVTNKRRGVVAIAEPLWPVLYEAIYQYGPPWEKDRVLPPGPRGKFSTTYHKCKDLQVAAGINEPGVARHVFRKTGPSHAAQAGVKLEFIAEALCDDPATTRRSYVRYTPEHTRAVVNQVKFLPVAPSLGVAAPA